MYDDGPIYYYYGDHLGTARVTTDDSGNKCYDADYFPWGLEQDVYVNSCPQHYKFTGKERDPDMHVDYFGARFYNDNMARFYSPDWSASPEPVPYAKLDNPQSLNLYTYVLNNPLRFVDAGGHEVDLDNKNKRDRNDTQRRLVSNTSKAEQKLFKLVTDPSTGTTKLVLTDAAKSFKGTHTVAFTRLADAIGQKNVISVGIHNTFIDTDGQSHSTPLGGITIGPAPGIAGNATTTLNRNGLGAGDMSVVPGSTVPAPMNIIAAHEVMRHGLEILNGGDPTEHHVWEIENQMRQEQGLLPRPPE